MSKDTITFTQKQVMKLTEARAVQLQNWTNRGFVEPEVNHPGKTGKRHYSFVNIVAVRTLVVLTRLGMPPQFCNSILDDVEARARRIAIGRLLLESPTDSFNNIAETHEGLNQQLGGQTLGVEYQEPSRKRVLILEPIDKNYWKSSIADFDEFSSFDPTDLSDAIIILRLDEMIQDLWDKIFGKRGGSDE